MDINNDYPSELLMVASLGAWMELTTFDDGRRCGDLYHCLMLCCCVSCSLLFASERASRYSRFIPVQEMKYLAVYFRDKARTDRFPDGVGDCNLALSLSRMTSPLLTTTVFFESFTLPSACESMRCHWLHVSYFFHHRR